MTEKYQDPAVKQQFLDKMNKTLLANHGVKWPVLLPDYKEKRSATMEAKYGPGITHNSLIPGYREINERRLINSSYSTKEYTWPSGRISKIQGYEDMAINHLLKIFNEDEIKIFSEEDLNPIPYVDENGKNRNYYPDIILPNYKTIVEVKSRFTMEKDLETNRQKKLYCEKLGFDFVWLVYDERGGEPINNNLFMVQDLRS